MKRTAAVTLAMTIGAAGFVAGHWYSLGTSAGTKVRRAPLYYVDPMHPAYKSDKPGIAPDCGMDLEPVYADRASAPGAQPGMVNVSVEKQQRIGVQVSTVERTAMVHKLRLFGRVVPDETGVYKLLSGMDGFIREVSGVTTGSRVTKDQWLATFSAPEIRLAVDGFLVALDVIDRQRQGNAQAPIQIKMADQSLRQSQDRLINLGMSPVQVEEIKKNRSVPTELRIHAPAAGFVLSRNVSTGQRFEKGFEWYRIADLSRVWILAEVFEKDSTYIRPGMAATVMAAPGGAELKARVSDVLPQFDADSRTLKLRLEVENPEFKLRPDMFVDVHVPVALPASLTIPASAVLDSGVKRRVYVERGEGEFEPRQVETGWRFDDRIQIVSGLEAGEIVVTAANFLLDSETRLADTAAAVRQTADKDPVCGMPIAAAATANSVEYQGQCYHFCSKTCRHKFDQSPASYVQHAANDGRKGGSGTHS